MNEENSSIRSCEWMAESGRPVQLIDHTCLFLFTDRSTVSEIKGLRANINDFTIKDLIGRGHFGEVFLAKEKITNDAYAIKKMPKSTFAQSKEERNILAISHSDWIPSLQYAFQVSHYSNAP